MSAMEKRYPNVEDAIAAMNSGFAKEYHPDHDNHAKYLQLYERYQKLGEFTEGVLFN